MNMKGSISSPGRICLFGEHQDYLGLPVIPMAINKRLKLNYQLEKNPSYVTLGSYQVDQVENMSYTKKPNLSGSIFDYLFAVYNYFWDQMDHKSISKLIIDSNIPIRAGLSSSAALLVATTFLFNKIHNLKYSPKQLAEIAFYCEHDILGVSCGRMDQYASSLGGIFYMTSSEKPTIIPLNFDRDAIFVIGNSNIERKADLPLKTVQESIFHGLRILKYPNLNELNLRTIEKANLTNNQKTKLKGVICVRNNTKEALDELNKKKQDLDYIGTLLSKQQSYLKSNYGVSHPTLDKMCKISEKCGALGAKLTGAGFGGCMFALCINKKVARRIRDELHDIGTAFITTMDSGVRED
ncbi:MAG: galactokinase family protein [Candidatus Thorarchaeota archaeon]